MENLSNGQFRCRIPLKRDGKATSRLSLSPWFFSLLLLFLINNTDVKGFSISRTVRSQYGHHVFSQSRVGSSRFDVEGDLESLVAQAVIQGPYLLDTDDHHLISVDTRVRWTCDNIVAIDGRENYQGLSQQWTETTMKDLAESRYAVTTVSTLRPNVISVTWNITFVSDSITSLVWWCRALGVKVSFFDILDRERVRSSFSWEALRLFLVRVLTQGVALLPHAVIVGNTEFVFRDTSQNAQSNPSEPSQIVQSNTAPRYLLTSSVEKLSLVRAIDRGSLKNRKLATDLVEFLDARRPTTVGMSQWNNLVVTRVNTRSVPGMGQFDVDGLEGERQNELLEGANKVLGTITALILASGLYFGSTAINKVLLYQDIHRAEAAVNEMNTLKGYPP